LKAIILAAGMGTRLGSLIPKPLTSLVNEKTILDFQVEKLSKVIGLHNIIAVVGYKKELVMEKHPDLSFVYNVAYTQTNTSKSLLTAINKVDEDVLWMNGDVYFDEAVLKMLIDMPHSSCLVDMKKCGDEEIKYTLNSDDNIHELSKEVKDGVGEAVGINLIRRNDLHNFKTALKKVANKDYFEKALEVLTKAGKLRLKPVHLGNSFCKEIDFEEDLREVQGYISSQHPELALN
jgi:choline kinase